MKRSYVIAILSVVAVVLLSQSWAVRPAFPPPPLRSIIDKAHGKHFDSAPQSPCPACKKCTSSPSVDPLPCAGGNVSGASFIENASNECIARVTKEYQRYYAYSQKGVRQRQEHGALRIAAFSRLWVPPLHGTGGMQYHALHLYSQMAALGHTVHVFVTGPPDRSRKLHFSVDAATLKLSDASENDAQLTVHQVASAKNGEYSEEWYENVLTEFTKVNKTVHFQVAHSESWAGVPNIYQIGLQMAVTWHGSMLDWFRNELNLIVHNFRMKGKMTSKGNAERMQSLGASVAYEAYMLLTVPHHIVISDSAEEDLREINLIESDQVHLIYNGVNPTNFKPDPSARASFLSEHKVDANDFVVGCGGRLEGIKGHHQLSKAMEVVLKRHSNVTLLVAGSGGEGKRYQELKHQGMKVVMLGMLKQQKLASFYAALDLFIDPFYQHHGLNTVMIEAVLSGTPIIATHLASSKTTAPCNEFGRTFALGVVDDLVRQIEFYMSHEEDRVAVGKRVRDRATHLFTSSVMANAYETLLYTSYLNPVPLTPIVGPVKCKRAYPAMCYREPHNLPQP